MLLRINKVRDTENEKKLKNLVIVLAVVVFVLLAAFLAYIWIDRSKMVGDLTIEKEQLTEQTEMLKEEYATLTTNNDSLNVQLSREREKVDQLIERVKKTEATNRCKTVSEKELGTLRSIMRSYIVQIDVLEHSQYASEKRDSCRKGDEVEADQAEV